MTVFNKAMSDTPKASRLLNRRDFALLSAAALTTASFTPAALRAQEPPAEIPKWQAHIDAIKGDREAVEDRVTLDLPEGVENGNVVPFTVAVDYPMTDTDYVQAIHLIATGNHAPAIASFYFTPLSGAARASSRMRLLQTQEIVALAQTSGGAFYVGRRRVEVVVGCCGGRPAR